MSREYRTKHKYKGIAGLANIAEHFGIPYSTLTSRVISLGWPMKKAVEAPIKTNQQNGLYRKDSAATFSRSVFKNGQQVKILINEGRNQAAVKYPFELSVLWRLALGMQINHEVAQ